MKIIKNLVITTALILIFTMSASALPSDLWDGDERIEALYDTTVKEDIREKDMLQNLLIYLGILDEDFTADAPVKKTDLIKAVSAINNLSYDNAAEQAKYLKGMRLIRFEDTEGNAGYNELIYTALALTGYAQPEDDGKLMIIAANNKLLNNIYIANDRPANMSEMAQILYNALSIPAREVSYLSGRQTGVKEYKYSKTEPLLKSLFNIELRAGEVTAAAGFILRMGERLSENQIEINSVIYPLANKIDGEKVIGRKCRYFFDIKKEAVLFVEAIPERNETVRILPYQLTGLTNNKISYQDSDGKNKNITIEVGTDLVINGMYTGTYTVDAMNKYTDNSAEIIVLDNGTMQYVFVWQYRTYPVKYVVSGDSLLVFKDGYRHNGQSYIDLDDEKLHYTIVKNGEVCSLEDIAADNVVSVAQSLNKTGESFLRIVVSDVRKNLTLEEMAEDYYICGGTKYYVSSALREYLISYAERHETLELGNTYNLAVNHMNEISDLKASRDYRYGFIMQFDEKKASAFNPEMTIKLFDEDGSFKTLDLEEEIMVYDEDHMKGTEMDEKAACTYIITKQPDDPRFFVQYKINSDNEITEMYFSVDNTGNKPGTLDYPMTLDFAPEEKLFYFENGLAYKYRATADLKIFVIPDVQFAEEEKYYSLRKPNYKGNGVSLPKMELYGVNDYYVPGAALMRETAAAGIDEYSTVYVVDKIAYGYDDTGYESTILKAWTDGECKNLYSNDDSLTGEAQSGWYVDVKLTDLKRGDIIQASTNGNNIAMFKVLFRPDSPGEYRCQCDDGGTFTWGEEMHQLAVFYGRFKGIKNNMIMINTSNTDEEELSAHYIYSDTAIKFYLVDSEKKEVRVIDKAAVVEGDRIVIHNRYTRAWGIFVYR